jgi:hypothetical protein
MSLLRRAAVLVATLAVSLIGGTVVPVAAAEPTASVVVALRVADPAALDALSHATGLSPAARHARLAALIPGASRHADVSHRAAALGLRVTHEDSWSETVTGPVSLVRAVFGSASAPTRPAAFATSAVAVLPTSGHVAYPLATLPPEPKATTGDDLRKAYSAPAGTDLGQGLTIATVQLSGWKSADLTSYGTTLSPPVTPSYTAVSINHADPAKPDGFRGDAEVALDQETLLAVAPAAAQRAYFAPNNDGGTGFVKAVHAVANDASADHIAALSISWGVCESGAGSQFMSAMDQALQVAVAAGVTVFAASGDEGSRDCLLSTGSAVPAVDYPASSPYVVGVGGTTLPKPPSVPTAWSGSGGGESSHFALPSWQQSVRAKSPHGRRLVPDISSAGAPAYGIAVLDTVPTDKNLWWNVIGGTSFGSPTQAALLTDSLGSSGWAGGGIGDVHPALYDAAVADNTAFTDVTSGSNGTYSAAAGFDLVTGLGGPQWSTIVSWLGAFTLTAPAGTQTTTVSLTVTPPLGLPAAYRSWSAPAVGAAATCDTATAPSPPTSVDLGVGAPDGAYTVSVAGIDGSAANAGSGACHVVQTTVVLDRTAPVAIASVRPVTRTTAIASWGSTDPAPSSGRSSYAVTIVDSGGTLYSATTTATSVTFAASAYRSYHVNVIAIDPAGNHSPTASAHLYDDVSLTYTTGWQTLSSTSYYRNARHVTTQKAGASMAGAGTIYVVYVTTCPTCGRLAAYHGNTLLRVVSLTTNRIHTLVPITLLTAPTTAKRTITLRAARASATATSVQIDAAVIR